MSFIDNIQLKLARFFLKKRSTAQREVQATNIKDAKKVGIVYCADDEESTELVKRYVKFLKDYKISVMAIGYFDLKELPPDVNPKLEFDFITKKELNLQLEPKGVVVENFVRERYDILIDVNVEDHVVMEYLVKHSMAKFKVGAQNLGYANLFDLTIVLKDGEGARQLLKNIDRYLHVIKN